MDQTTLSLAAYWRTSLADAELGRGGLGKKDLAAYTRCSLQELHEGRLDATCVDYLFDGQDDDTQFISVVVRPQVYIQKTAHGEERRGGNPPYLLPVYGSAVLSRSGRLYPTGKAVVPRDILEPLSRPAFAIGTIDALDEFLTRHPAPMLAPVDPVDASEEEQYQENWASYLAWCQRMVREVAPDWDPVREGYLPADCCYIGVKTSASGASKHILSLYDHIALSQPSVPLLARYASPERPLPQPCLPENTMLAARLAHASDQYPLATAQRDSLSHLLAAGDGDITCVNGPPGTGKTTLLLSVVATLWASAALDGGEPPVIIAASTNNQAVTNIIDAFGRDFATGEGPLGGRWLPHISSFGAYFPSMKKEKEANGKYQTRAFFDEIETATYVKDAGAFYLEQARAAFPALAPVSVDAVVLHLQDAIRSNAEALSNLESCWSKLVAARETARRELGENPAQKLHELKQRHTDADTSLRRLRQRLTEWEAYLASESIWLSLFTWLPAVARKRLRLARQFWNALPSNAMPEIAWQQPDDAEALLKQHIASASSSTAALAAWLAQATALLEAEQQATQAWQRQAAQHGIDGAAPDSLGACDRNLDIHLRFDMFRLATHYWEGRWLQEMHGLLPELDKEKRKNGRVACTARWRRRMKLTPCAVSTFYMLPAMMGVQRKDADQFVPDFLYNFIDLLIVDEAGQVLPEVAGASFALAKSSLVIGDTMQIEPIWSIPRHVDVGNLIGHGLLDPAKPIPGYQRIAAAGQAAASGSVMRIAQFSSPYQYDADLSPGLYLYEHRRCYDAIIEYCNTLCYKGKLLPLRGARPAGQTGLPALGYLHIDGLCQKSQGGSSFNALEAQTIASWLLANKSMLEAQYGKPLAEVVGIVTPFSAQVEEIQKACRQLSLTDQDGADSITIGTVHALQGAERPVIIFSQTYSKHLDGRFIDARSSMLNVAVSRAKDSFLVFGDMDLLEVSAPSTPRGLLARLLFRDPTNALEFESSPRADLTAKSRPLIQLRDAGEHDAFLLDVLAKARREVRIVSPWLKAHVVRQSVLWTALQEAAQRGVSVRIYTDDEYNKKYESEMLEVIEELRQHGISTAVVNKIHSKILAADLDTYCVGSFNWLSSQRGQTYARHETSLVYHGNALKEEIDASISSLERRIVRLYAP